MKTSSIRVFMAIRDHIYNIDGSRIIGTQVYMDGIPVARIVAKNSMTDDADTYGVYIPGTGNVYAPMRYHDACRQLQSLQNIRIDGELYGIKILSNRYTIKSDRYGGVARFFTFKEADEAFKTICSDAYYIMIEF